MAAPQASASAVPPAAPPVRPAAKEIGPAPKLKEKVTRIEPKEVEVQATETPLAGECSFVIVSPDGKTVVCVDRDGDAYAVGSTRRPAQKVLAVRSAFAPDGRSLVLRTTDSASQAGMVVLGVPGMERLHASDAAEHVHYLNARTIVFHENGIPKSLDLASGKVTTLGSKLPDFACPGEEMALRRGVSALVAACRERRWTRVLGADEASGRWLLGDLEGHAMVMRRVRLVDPATGASETLAEAGGEGWLDAQLSGDMALSFAGPGRVVINHDHATRIIELATGAVLELPGGNKAGFHGSHAVGRDAYASSGEEAVWVDLESGKRAILGKPGRQGSSSRSIRRTTAASS